MQALRWLIGWLFDWMEWTLLAAVITVLLVMLSVMGVKRGAAQAEAQDEQERATITYLRDPYHSICFARITWPRAREATTYVPCELAKITEDQDDSLMKGTPPHKEP